MVISDVNNVVEIGTKKGEIVLQLSTMPQQLTHFVNNISSSKVYISRRLNSCRCQKLISILSMVWCVYIILQSETSLILQPFCPHTSASSDDFSNILLTRVFKLIFKFLAFKSKRASGVD
jgi:hypothetical protein